MPRPMSILCLPVALAFAASAHSAELPVIVNGTALARADNAPPPAQSKGQLPTIVNLSSLAVQPAPADGKKPDTKTPMIVNQAPAAKAATPVLNRYVVDFNAYAASDYVRPVGYNGYVGYGGLYSGYSAYGYNGGVGAYSASYGYGYGGSGYTGYGFVPAIVDFRPPLVEVLDTGVRANIGRLSSMPAIASPVYGEVIGVYYFR